jgi:hypothetical protein
MEQTPESPKETPQMPSQPMPKKADAAFSLFGKIVIIILLVGILAGGGYYAGTHTTKTAQPPVPPTVTPQLTQAKVSPTASQPVSPTLPAKKKINAGQPGATSFSKYTVDVPSGWTDTRDTTAVSDKLTLAKNGYALTILQAAVDGGGCVYKGEPPVAMAQTFSNFVGITGSSAQFRRGWNADAAAKTLSYTVCQQNTTDKSFGTLTTFGRIDATAPNPSDDATLAELDSIVASLVKQ